MRAAFVLALSLMACDEEPPETGPLDGAYDVSWTCASPSCVNPIPATREALIAGTAVEWSLNGNVELVTAGDFNDGGDCILFGEGVDRGVPRSNGTLCFNAEMTLIEGAFVWDGTFSDVVLAPM